MARTEVRTTDVLALLGAPPRGPRPPWTVEVADARGVEAHRRLRHDAFVVDQGLFEGSDRDEVDDDPRTVVLVARGRDGEVLAGVRLAPCTEPELGWWAGSRLVCAPGVPGAVGAALVRAACAHAEGAGALRFDACVQARHEPFFTRLGWRRIRDVSRFGSPHVEMRWPIDRLARRAEVKAPIGELLAAARPGGAWVGDDGVPLPGSDVVAATDAIVPSMLERDPRWAGWCGVLVNVNDLAAMGAPAIGLLDALAAPTSSLAHRIAEGMLDAARAWDVPVLGGHTQLGVPAALAITALGRTTDPVPGGGARPGDALHLTADLGGGWRRGYGDAQWDSTTHRPADVLRAQHRLVHDVRPRAAKDVSMAGVVGTVGMLAEASGTGAELDVAEVPRPDAATFSSWLGCFPGFAVVTAGEQVDVGRLPLATAPVGRATTAPGTRLRWPDGETTEVLGPSVTGLGPADRPSATDHRPGPEHT